MKMASGNRKTKIIDRKQSKTLGDTYIQQGVEIYGGYLLLLMTRIPIEIYELKV